MKSDNIEISDNKKLERFNKIKKNRKLTRVHILMLIVLTIVYFLTLILDILMYRSFKWYKLNPIFGNVFVITNAILFLGYLVFWCVKFVKLDKEKKQLLEGYKILEILNYISEVDYMEYAKYLGVKPEVDREEIKNEDINLFNLTDKNRQKRKHFLKLFNITASINLLMIFGCLFIWFGFENVFGKICGVMSLIFGFILILFLITSFVYVTFLDKKYEKLILSYDYKKYIRYKNEEL